MVQEKMKHAEIDRASLVRAIKLYDSGEIDQMEEYKGLEQSYYYEGYER